MFYTTKWEWLSVVKYTIDYVTSYVNAEESTEHKRGSVRIAREEVSSGRRGRMTYTHVSSFDSWVMRCHILLSVPQ